VAIGQIVVLGLIAGGIYGLFAVGVVLIYRGSGSLNFAQGEIGTFSLYVAWFVVTAHHLPWILGAAAAVAVAAALGAGFEFLVVRPMVDASRLAIAVATIGLLSLLLAGELRVYSASPRVVSAPIAGIGPSIFGVHVSPTQVLALLATIGVGVGLAVLLRRTDFGLGVLAAAQDPTAARLVGVPVARVSSFVWGAAAAAAALGALLIEPTIGVFAPGFASELFLKGLAAAIIGGLNSLTGAFVGGVTVGILEAAATRWIHPSGLPGIADLTIFVIVLGVLLVRPRGLLSGVRSARAAAS
jgi:branched-subunit amino acid ABC-type transport system permease component